MSGHSYLAGIVLLILARHFSESKNFVFLPFMVTSHVRLHTSVARELSKMDHNVWIGLPSGLGERNESYPGVHTFSANEFWESSVDKISYQLEATVSMAIETGTEPDWTWLLEYEDYIPKIYFEAMQNGKIIEYLRSLKPDLIVLDWSPSVNEQVAIAYALKVPFAILTAGFQDPITSRVPFNPVAEAYNSPYFRNQATLFEKVGAVIKIMSPLFQHIYNDRGYTKLLFPEEPDVPTANELMSQAEVYIVESDHIFDYPRPALPNLKRLGSLSSSPAKELQEPFKSFVERSQKAGIGVAVLSFGSLFMNLPKEIEVKMVSVLRRIKLNTIWRANLTSPDPDKILTSTWIPQNDLLGHKNVKVFMTHSGTHSICEGIYHGVPMVCLPVFFDQVDNAERAADKGYCLSLDFLKASEVELVKVIEEVASSQKIRSTIGTASEIYRQLYKDPKKEAAFWLDHVMRYGGSYMRYSGQKIPMYLFVMDYFIVFMAGVVFAVGVFIICFVVKESCKFCFRPMRHLKKD